MNRRLLSASIITCGCVLVFPSSTAEAAPVTPIAPFQGAFSEGFESFAIGDIPGPADNLSGPVSILEGNGTLSGLIEQSNRTPLFVWAPGGFGLNEQGLVEAEPFDGVRGVALKRGLTTLAVGRIEFLTPVTEFGAYWVHAVTEVRAGPISVSFLSHNDELIDTAEFHYDIDALQGVSEWHGWRSHTPIHAVEFTGFFAGLDGVQINVVPEPTAVALLVSAIAGLLATRVRYTWWHCCK